MYKILADDTLIYDSTLEDYKIGKGEITLETNKSGSFTFSLYPDHFFYDSFVRMKTLIVVQKSNRIVFRGRILNDTTAYSNNKTITCEGELGFLQDSIIRPYTFTGTPAEAFRKFINDHNAQVDAFKRFKIGEVTVTGSNVTFSNDGYETALDNLTDQLLDGVGGHVHITHGDDGADPIPTIHYLSDFTRVASQTVEFGENLKDYTKTVKADNICSAIIPVGADIGEGDESKKLTIASVNGGADYVYSPEAVALYGWIFKTIEYDDIADASALKSAAENDLNIMVNQNITIELNAIDRHLLDRSIESFWLNDYIRVLSTPHGVDATLLCNKYKMDLLKPQNDALTLGYSYASFTGTMSNVPNAITTVRRVATSVTKIATQATSATVIANEAKTTAGAAVQTAYPIGSIYMSVVDTNPATLFGFGTWARIQDRFLLAAGGTYKAGATGGEASHTLTVAEMPQHTHTSRVQWQNTPSAVNTVCANGSPVSVANVQGSLSVDNGDQANIGYTGGSQAHNNMPPYLAVYVWQRTA